MRKWEHTALNIINVTIPIFCSFVIGVLLTAKLFNMEIDFILSDWAILIACLFIIFSFQKERFIELQKEFSQSKSNTIRGDKK